jgi:hypothetical protein
LRNTLTGRYAPRDYIKLCLGYGVLMRDFLILQPPSFQDVIDV